MAEMEASTMENIDLQAPVVKLAPTSNADAAAETASTRSNGGGFVPLVTVVGFHHAR